MGWLNLEDPDVLLASALRAHAVAASLETVMRSSVGAAQEAEGEARESVQRLTQAVSRVRTQLSQASDENVQARLRAELSAAENRLAEGQRLARLIAQEVKRVSDRRTQFLGRQGGLVLGLTQAQKEMVHDVDKARAILAAAPAGSVAGGISTSTASVATSLPTPAGRTGMSLVSLDEVIDPMEHVKTPMDFQKMSLSDMQVALNLLDAKVLRAVQSGAERGDMVSLDAAAGWSQRAVNHARTYDLFFGSDRIVLSRGASGYTVTNGAHRIWLARRMGITHLPATTDGRLAT